MTKPPVNLPVGYHAFVAFDHVHVHDAFQLSRFPVDVSELITYRPSLTVGYLDAAGAPVVDTRAYATYAELLELIAWLPSHQWIAAAAVLYTVHPRRVLQRLASWACLSKGYDKELMTVFCAKMVDVVDLFYGRSILTFEERTQFGQPRVEQLLGKPVSQSQTPTDIISTLHTVCQIPQLHV